MLRRLAILGAGIGLVAGVLSTVVAGADSTGTSPSARATSVAFVRALAHGQFPRACRLETKAARRGKRCEDLHPPGTSCPVQIIGEPIPHFRARRPNHQVRSLRIGERHATARLRSQLRRRRRIVARLILRRAEHHWRISGVRHNGRHYDLLLVGKPFGSPAELRASRLFDALFPSPCERPVFPHRHHPG